MVDVTVDPGLFVLHHSGSSMVDRWMSAAEVERVFKMPVAEVFRHADEPTLRSLRFPRGGRAQGSNRRVWRASDIVDWLSSQSRDGGA